MTQHTIHQSLPAGFTYATDSQRQEYDRTGFVYGASKVVWVDEGLPPGHLLAVRMRPPWCWDAVRSQSVLYADNIGTVTPEDEPRSLEWYVTEYNLGYAAGARAFSKAWDSGKTSAAWDDGYLDRRAERAKWHTTYCQDHDACGEV